MRTTVTLDPDVASLIRSSMKQKGVSFKVALNEAIRAGLNSRRRNRTPFRQDSVPLGTEQLFRWEKALAAAEAMEDEELIRKLALRK